MGTFFQANMPLNLAVGYDMEGEKECLPRFLRKMQTHGAHVKNWHCVQSQASYRPDGKDPPPGEKPEFLPGTENGALVSFRTFVLLGHDNAKLAVQIQQEFSESEYGFPLRCIDWGLGPRNDNEFYKELYKERKWQDEQGWPQYPGTPHAELPAA